MVTREKRKLHDEELDDLYSSPSVVLVIKSRRMSWARHIANMVGRDVYLTFWRGNLKERSTW